MHLYDYTDVATYKTVAFLTSASSGIAAVSADWATEWLGVPLPVLLAAVAGAALALSLLPPMPTRAMVISVALGTAVGVFAPQLLLVWWPALKPALIALAFACGLVGKLAATMIFDDGRALVVGWIKGKTGAAQ